MASFLLSLYVSLCVCEMSWEIGDHGENVDHHNMYNIQPDKFLPVQKVSFINSFPEGYKGNYGS